MRLKFQPRNGPASWEREHGVPGAEHIPGYGDLPGDSVSNNIPTSWAQQDRNQESALLI